MAALHGKQGKVTFAGTATANVTNWTINATADVVECAVMSNAAVTSATHWKDYVAGFKDWTATVECLLEDTGLDPDIETDFLDDDGVACIFYQGVTDGGGRKYSGNGVIVGVVPSLDKNDVAKATYTIQGSGTLTEAEDAS